MLRPIFCSVVLGCALLSASGEFAAAADVDVALTGLKNPSGVAVQPGSGVVYVSDSGAGKVVRWDPKGWDPKSPGGAIDTIVDFPKDVYGKGPMYDIGPLGLVFLNFQTLVVGGGGYPDGEELLRVYGTAAVRRGALKADAMKESRGPLGPSDETLKGEGNFYGLAASPNAIYVTCNGDDTKGWVSKVELKNGALGELKPFIATKTLVDVDAPVGIAIAKNGSLLVGQMGEMNVPNDSLLTAYNADDGSLIYSAETGLFDIAGLAVHPASGNIYAVDFAWMETGEGGLFLLDVSSEGDEVTVEAQKIASLDRPSALAFAPDGTLYVTTFGSGEGDAEDSGQLVVVSGLE